MARCISLLVLAVPTLLIGIVVSLQTIGEAASCCTWSFAAGGGQRVLFDGTRFPQSQLDSLSAVDDVQLSEALLPTRAGSAAAQIFITLPTRSEASELPQNNIGSKTSLQSAAATSATLTTMYTATPSAQGPPQQAPLTRSPRSLA